MARRGEESQRKEWECKAATATVLVLVQKCPLLTWEDIMWAPAVGDTTGRLGTIDYIGRLLGADMNIRQPCARH